VKRRCAICRNQLDSPSGGMPTTGRPRSTCSAACRQALYRRLQRKRTTLEIMGSSASVEWPTDPAYFAALVERFGPFDLDPCATVETAKCPRFFTMADDGLVQEWEGRVFMNPPYGRTIGHWMRKAWEASQSTAELVVCLVPARTDTRWWHDWAVRGEIEFVKGRLRFGDLSAPAPFPSALIVFRNANAVTKAPAIGEAA
jgi:phage N-6-adenine-methyltransferase